MHCGKRGTLQHNDHDPSIKNAEWDKTKTKDNFIWTCVKGCNNAAEAELKTFEKLYGDTLDKQNKKYIANRQYKRVKTMSEYMEASQHKASETILQIGDKASHVDDNELWSCAVEFINWKQKRFKDNYRCISASLHVDESTPHIHIRETWFFRDEAGAVQPGIKGAMREAGIPLPDPTKSEDKDNYRKAVADAECREKWQEIIVQHGIEIETEPLPRRQHMSKDAYKEYKQSVESLQSEREALEAERAANNAKMDEMISIYEERVQNAVRNVLARTRKDLSEKERREAVARAYDSMNIKEMTSQSDDVEYN